MSDTQSDPELARLRSLVLQMGFTEDNLNKYVSLGADVDMRFCVVRAEDGGWDVYYTERGSKSTYARVSTLRGAAYLLVGMVGRGDLVNAVERSVDAGHLR